MCSTYREVVSEGASWRDWTLGNSSWPIHICSTILVQSVEMQRSSHILKAVVCIDDDAISNIGAYLRDWPLIVDANNRSFELSVWISLGPCDVEVVSHCCCVAAHKQPARTDNEKGQRQRHGVRLARAMEDSEERV